MANARGELKSHWNPAADGGLVEVKSTSALLTYAQLTTENTSDCWFWLWNSPAENVEIGTTAPYAVLFIPAGDGAVAAGNVGEFSSPIELASGFCYAVSDSHESVSNASGWTDCQVQLFYR